MNKAFLVLLSFLFLSASLSAQRCHSELHLRQAMDKDVVFRVKRKQMAQDIQQWLENHPAQLRSPVDIQVVFHIVWHTNEENISDAQILSQLEVLNTDFRQMNIEQSAIPTNFQPSVADMELQFVLAETDPEGQPATGITRTFTNVENVGSRFIDNRRAICHDDLGGKDAWCPEHYLNVWVGAYQGALAQTSFPGQGPDEENGIRIRPEAVGTIGTVEEPYHLGRTLTHEIGHFFDLFHLWNFDECIDNDMVGDTPQQKVSYLNQCPNSPQISCGSLDMYMNFMNFTDDACMAMFSTGQKNRLWAVLNTTRSGFLDGAFCGDVTATTPVEEKEAIQIFPNPASDFVQVENANGSALVLKIYDTSSRLIQEIKLPQGQVSYRFSLEEWLNGVYYLQIFGDSYMKTSKLIVNKAIK
ncbi:MAG: zinc-dependent metalloprotease [Saprospiraceae bacterium]|nr:zinc-dependent metalloprotease [Saprospiraceae bacterium]